MLPRLATLLTSGRFETIKAVHLTATPFPESILTPTMKVKR